MGRWSGQGKNGTGGTRTRERFDPNERRADVGPVAAHVGLCKAILARRAGLRSSEPEKVTSMARDAANRPLSLRQLSWLSDLAAKVGAVHEDAPEPVTPPGCVSVQPWGALPARPPTRSIAG